MRRLAEPHRRESGYRLHSFHSNAVLRRCLPKPRKAREPTTSVAIPISQAQEIDRFLTAHPEFGIKDRNDFARRSISFQMNALRQEVYTRLVTEGQAPGKGPLEDLRKAGFKH